MSTFDELEYEYYACTTLTRPLSPRALSNLVMLIAKYICETENDCEHIPLTWEEDPVPAGFVLATSFCKKYGFIACDTLRKNLCAKVYPTNLSRKFKRKWYVDEVRLLDYLKKDKNFSKRLDRFKAAIKNI